MKKKSVSLIVLSLLFMTGCAETKTDSGTSNTDSPISDSESGKSESSSTSAEVIPSDITGSGTEDDPYVIYTADQLSDVATDYNSLTSEPEYTYYKLGHDIDMKGVDYTPIGTEDIPFFGEFDGDGYSITNFTMSVFSKSDASYGLFAYTYDSVIHDVKLSVDFSFAPLGATSQVYVGGLVGFGYNTAIYNIDIDGKIELFSAQNSSSRLYAGGIAGILEAGNNYYVSLTNSKSDVDVSCDMADSENTLNLVGGIAGAVLTNTSSSSLGIYSLASNYYHGNLSGQDCVGGIVGVVNYYVSVTDSVAEGDSITATTENGCYAGGILGQGYYETGVLNTYTNFKTITATNTSSSAYYKSFAGSTIGYAYSSYEDLSDIIGTVHYANYSADTAITSDAVGVNGLGIDAGKSVKATAGLSSYWSDNLKLSDYTTALTAKVSMDSNYADGSSQNENFDVEVNNYDVNGIKKIMSKSFTRDHYCYSGLYYDSDATQPYCFFIPFSKDTTLYAGYGDYSKLVGTYTYVCSSASSSYTVSGTWYFDEDYFYWENDYEITKYTYTFDGTYVFLDSSNTGAYAGEMFLLDSDGKLHAYDVNDSDYEYVATKTSAEFVIPDYTDQSFLGTWYFSNGAIVTLKADGNASAISSSSTVVYTGGYRVLADGSLDIKTSPRLNATVKYDETKSIMYGTTSTGAAVFGAKSEITKVYSSTGSDNTLNIYVVGEDTYCIYNGALNTYTGSLTEGGEIVVGDETYTVSGTTLTLKKETPSIPEDICGTYVDSKKNEMVLNSDGTGTWNGASFTWTYDATTKKGKISSFGAFDGDSNSVTFNDDGTVTITIDDSYNENTYTATMSRKAATPSYVGTWTMKAMSNTVTLVLNSDGTGTYNGTSITYTVSGNKISVSDVGDLENIEFTFDDTKGITSGSYEYDYETYYYSNITKSA